MSARDRDPVLVNSSSGSPSRIRSRLSSTMLRAFATILSCPNPFPSTVSSTTCVPENSSRSKAPKPQEPPDNSEPLASNNPPSAIYLAHPLNSPALAARLCLLRYDRGMHPTSIAQQGGARHVCSEQFLSNRRVDAAKGLSSSGSASSPARAPKRRGGFAKRRVACGQHRHTRSKNSLPSATRSGS